MDYILQSDRLGFRPWCDTDMELMVSINSDPDVMQYFPSVMSRQQTEDSVQRFQRHQQEHGYCYFAVDQLQTKSFIGFIGLMQQQYPFSPQQVVDIGWRLDKRFWRQGLASEGARCCLEFASERLGLSKVVAVAPKVNVASIAVMKKIGMEYSGEFHFERLPPGSHLNPCVYYETDFSDMR